MIEIFKDVGNIKEGYIYVPKWVVPGEIIYRDSLSLKSYNLFIKNPAGSHLVGEARSFLIRQRKEDLEKGIGLGFAIGSDEGSLKVATWHNEIPERLITASYHSTSHGNFMPVENEGFDVWELAIVEHERKDWIKYLQSEKREEDKRTYLESTICDVCW